MSAALREDGVPERALLRAEETDVFALSAEVEAEINEHALRTSASSSPSPTSRVSRPRRRKVISTAQRNRLQKTTVKAGVATLPGTNRSNEYCCTDCGTT